MLTDKSEPKTKKQTNEPIDSANQSVQVANWVTYLKVNRLRWESWYAGAGVVPLTPVSCLLQLDSEHEALRARLRTPNEKVMYTLVSVPDGNDISSIFELDPTTLRGGDSLVPRYGDVKKNPPSW